MVDYAQVKALEQETVKSESKVRSIYVNPLYLSIAILTALAIYFVAYQNMSIAQTKHEINAKRVLLRSLILEQQSLIKNRNQFLNPKHILSVSGKPASYVEIAH